MARKIIMTGDEAQYIERRGANSVDDDREIRMEGKHARYEENGGAQATHFPHQGSEEAGRQWFEFQMGFSVNQPAEVRPVEWLKTVETARLMLYKVCDGLLASGSITKSRIGELASQCFTKQGEPLKLAKPRKENSIDVDAIEQFLPMD